MGLELSLELWWKLVGSLELQSGPIIIIGMQSGIDPGSIYVQVHSIRASRITSNKFK